MYERFYGFRERPFDLTPNPRFLYLTGKHREALSILQYGISGRKGITLLTGEAGTGKTTLVRAAIDLLTGPLVYLVYVNNPTLLRGEFYQFLARQFGLSSRAALSKAEFLAELEETLHSRHKAGATTALIIDEAQSLPGDLMEEVRLLANFETETEKLLPVVLSGQPELADRLEETNLRQLKQRVALRCELQPLGLRETAAYVAGRVAIAGGEAPRVFTREAVGVIFERSRGIPRTISVLCDNALVTGFAAGVKPVTAEIVLDVCRDFHLPAPDVEPAVPEAQAPPVDDATVVAPRGLAQPGANVAGVIAIDGQPTLREGVTSRPLIEKSSPDGAHADGGHRGDLRRVKSGAAALGEGKRAEGTTPSEARGPGRSASEATPSEPESLERGNRTGHLFGLFTKRRTGRSS
jgi:general secretion pathway protein A